MQNGKNLTATLANNSTQAAPILQKLDEFFQFYGISDCVEMNNELLLEATKPCQDDQPSLSQMRNVMHYSTQLTNLLVNLHELTTKE